MRISIRHGHYVYFSLLTRPNGGRLGLGETNIGRAAELGIMQNLPWSATSSASPVPSVARRTRCSSRGLDDIEMTTNEQSFTTFVHTLILNADAAGRPAASLEIPWLLRARQIRRLPMSPSSCLYRRMTTSTSRGAPLPEITLTCTLT